MGGGSPLPSSADDDGPPAGFRHENQSPWLPFVSGFGFGTVENLDPETSSLESLLPAGGVSTIATGYPSSATYGSRGPGISWSAQSEATGNYVRGFPGVLGVNGIEQLTVSKPLPERGFDTRTEKTVQPTQLSRKVSTDLTKSEPLQHVRKRIFKLMQIVNDNQDLSFVEKVILSQEEIFGLCNNIRAGSAKSSEGRKKIDFGSLDSKSMNVIGFFGSKDVMREIFRTTKLTEERNTWMQIQNDTLDPGLYAWLDANFIFVIYWHRGHSLPKATRKDMSCNFIRYMFDLCDTVCICLEAKNLKNSLLGQGVPRFLKHQRTQRLQISLVKASEDSAKVTDGFLLKGLCFGDVNAFPGRKSVKNTPLKSAIGDHYKLSEGVGRVALLVSSPRPRKLSSSQEKKDLRVSEFPSFIEEMTRGYSLDLRDLSDSDFELFICSAKLKEADDFATLVRRNESRKDEERNKMYTVDQFVEKEQEHLSLCVGAFIDSFLKANYPWEESLDSASKFEDPNATSKAGQDQQSEQSRSFLLCSTSDSLVEPEMRPSPVEEEDREISHARLNQLENDIYNLLLGKDSKQRIVFPTSVVSLFNLRTESYRPRKMEGGPHFVFSIEETNANITNKFVPICYGNKVALRSTNNASVAVKTGILQRYGYEGQDDQCPVLTDEEIVFTVDGSRSREKLRMTLEPACRTGDLSEWLNQQAANMGSPCGWKHAALLTAISQKLASGSGRGIELSEVLARQTLLSMNPLDSLQSILHKPVDLKFAQAKWEELRGLPAPSVEMHQTTIAEDVKDICVNMYTTLRSNLRLRIPGQISRFTSSLLKRKVRKQISESFERLEAKLKEEEEAFLASQKDVLSRRTEATGPLTLTVQACKLVHRSEGSWMQRTVLRWVDGSRKISISFARERFEKESITWHGLELAPMKEDLDKLSVDNEHAFTPSCSASKEIIDLDPSSQTLLKVVFLKAGQLLVFIVKHNDPKEFLVYLCPKLGMKLSDSHCIKIVKRGFDLVAYDERSRFIALYDGSMGTIKTFRFDETFRHMDWIGVDISLGEYPIGPLIWMEFVTGKNEIVFIDDLHRVRLCEVNQPGLVRSGNVHVGSAPIVKSCVTTHGSCLLLLRKVKSMEESSRVGVKQEETDNGAGPGSSDCKSEGLGNEMNVDSAHPTADSVSNSLNLEEQGLTLDVYRLDDSIQYFSSIPLDVSMKDMSKLVVGLASFASQMHLMIFDSDSPSVLRSKVIKISLASEVCRLEQVKQPNEEAHTDKNREETHSGPVLDYIYQIFEKYATSPPLNEESRELHLRVVLAGPVGTDSSTSLSDKCFEYINSSLDRLKREKGKDFSGLEIHTSVHDAEIFRSRMDLPWSVSGASQVSSAGIAQVQMGAWMRRLVCLVPIQIARAEHNALKPMIDGLQLSGNVDYVDSISLADVMRCGLYEVVFDSWTGPVKVISSMGKQSSGKSYLLNHLSGSLLDVAGGRCTDGVWMTVRQGNGCLYVLLDFEGLGSFERSEQEDMLLSMLNAAISNLTIFNKKDFHLDKETEAIFERFQNGVALVKTDAKLFRGLFYMAIKDVDISDVEDLKKEFFSKISQICSKSQDNFLTRMYGGAIEISAMPSFNRPEFHESIADIAQTIQQLEANYQNGRSFLLDLKLIIAQISTKDWSPIDSKRVALRMSLLRKHLQSAVSVGCFVSDGVSNPLIRFDDQVEISDEPLLVDEIDFFTADTGLELTAFQEKKVTGDILLGLMTTFKNVIDRKGEDEEWHAFFEKFVSALVLRRKGRVLQWITFNTSDFSDDGDVQKLQLEAVALLAEVQQNLILCSCKCHRCFLRCLQEKGHPSDHSCMGDHKCVAMCTYCLEEESNLGAAPCNDSAGHAGPHDCQQKSHTCGKSCIYEATSSNCNGNCSYKSGHVGDHRCNSRQHTCNHVCSLPFCENPCVSPIDVGNHEIHACHEKFCPVRCTMQGCNRTCATEDHFHGIKTGVTHHFCGSEHPCLAKCEYKGNCEVLTEVSKKTQTFTGLRATFEYVLVSEQNGNRKGCCIVIPPFKDKHEGDHSHSSNPDAVHFCETRCQSCGYFCTRPMEHGGLHATTHGNMRDVKFVAESEEIDLQDRKYAWGESGVAEMCQMHCKAQGRGHIHLVHCPANMAGGTCRKVFDGAQHEVRKYGPDIDLPKDELTHAAFWEYVRFEDPCSAEERNQFAFCNHQCKSDEHNPGSGGASSSAVQNISYCTESMWHVPIPKTDLAKFGTGYITDDGHHFSCDHSTNVAANVFFVIDRSGSMDWTDIKPSMTKFSSSGHNNRLGCVYEAILRFIRTRLSSVREDTVSVILFNDSAETVIHLQEMKESLVDEVLKYRAVGGTTYCTGLQHAEQILSLAGQDARLSRKIPIIIFLSDGGNNGGGDPLSHIRSMKALDPKLQFHTIMFGNDPSRKILEDMAKAGDGTFEVSLDEVQLSRRFEGLAKSLRPQVAALL